MLIGLINELIELEGNSKDEAEKVLIQLFEHDDDYNHICEKIVDCVTKKRKEQEVRRRERAEAICEKYGYTTAICLTDKFPTVLTKDKQYKVLYSEAQDNDSYSYVIDDNYDVKAVSYSLMKYINQVKFAKSEIDIAKVINLEYTKEEYGKRLKMMIR